MLLFMAGLLLLNQYLNEVLHSYSVTNKTYELFAKIAHFLTLVLRL